MPRRKGAPSQRKKRKLQKPLQERVNLKAVRITESHAKLTIKDGKLPSTTVSIKAEANFGVNSAEKTVVGNLVVTVATALPENTEGDNGRGLSSIDMAITMQCVFDVDEPPEVSSLSEQEMKAVNQLITIIAWPYVRQYVAMMTSGMGVPPFTLPLMKVDLSVRNGSEPEEASRDK